MDIIERLRELRQSSESSVVVGNANTSPHERIPYKHPLEAWLVNFILDQLTDPAGLGYTLVVLAGNAGDGKSYLLRQIRRTLVQHDVAPDLVRWLLDATESDSPAEGSEERLGDFFYQLSDEKDWTSAQLHVVAMNTGTAARFMEYCKASGKYRDLRAVLSVQLAIDVASSDCDDAFWRRYDRVLVVDLDRRMLVPLTAADGPPADGSFMRHIFEAVSPNTHTSVVSGAPLQCTQCPAAAICPVFANLQALTFPAVRQRLSAILLDISLEDRVHVGPRGLWHLIYLMTVGGLDAAQVEASRPLLTCAEIANADQATRSRGLFFSSLFDKSLAEFGTVPGALMAELQRLDPATRFTLASHEAALASGISCDEDASQSHEIASRFGLSAEAIRGPADDPDGRALSAMRRAFFFTLDDPDPVRHEWLRKWAMFLERWRTEIFSGGSTRSESAQVLVDVLKQLFAAAGRTDFIRLDLPWRSKQELYARLSVAADRRVTARDARVLAPDHERPHGPRSSCSDLSRCIDAYPLAVIASLKDGPKVRITWPLFRMLQRVQEQKYLALSLSPERVQHLERVGASLGASAAFSHGVAVRQESKMQLCCEDEGGIDVIDF